MELCQLVLGYLSLLLKGYRSGQGQGRVHLVNIEVHAEFREDGRQGRPRKGCVRDME